jgi:hypothetical protein
LVARATVLALAACRSSTTAPATSTTLTAPAHVTNHVPERTGDRLVIAGYGSSTPSFAELDVDSGTLTGVPLPAGLDPTFDNFQFVPTTGGLVVLGSLDTGAGHAVMPVLRYPQLSAAPITIGHATVIFSAARADRLWVTSDLATGIGPGTVHLTEIDLKGTPVGTLTIQAPAGGVVEQIAPVTDGFVATTTRGAEDDVVHYPVSGSPTTVGAGRLLAAAGTTVVWSTARQLHVTDLVTGASRTFAEGQDLSFPTVVSPDGTHLLAHVAAAGDSVELVDLRNGVTTAGPQISQLGATSDAASANVYFVEADQHHIDLWHAADNIIVRFPAPAQSITAIAVAPPVSSKS